MAGLEALDTSLTQDIEDMQIQEFKIIQTSKKKDSILYDGFYFNHMRDNKNSTVFKCRHIIEVDGKKKECTGNFTLQSDRKTFKASFSWCKNFRMPFSFHQLKIVLKNSLLGFEC
jgi:hypothetical protein